MKHKMTKLTTNSLRLIEFPSLINAVQTSIQYADLNRVLGPIGRICYHLYGGKLFFVGEEEETCRAIRAGGFTVSDCNAVKVDLALHWEVLQVIFYKALGFFFMGKRSLWKPRRAMEVFVKEPKELEGVVLVHEITNYSDRKLIVYEGFRYSLRFVDNDLVLSLLPRVKPTIVQSAAAPALQMGLPLGDIVEASPAVIRSEGFYSGFRRVALKPNLDKLRLLKTFTSLISEQRDEIVLPVGNVARGLVFASEFLETDETEADFYGA